MAVSLMLFLYFWWGFLFCWGFFVGASLFVGFLVVLVWFFVFTCQTKEVRMIKLFVNFIRE